MTRPPPPRAATPAECALPAWLPRLAPHTFATELLPLPADLAAYLAAGDGVWLGAESRAVPKPPRLDPYDDRCASWADSDEDGEGSVAGSAPSSSSTPPPARPPPPSAAAFAPSVDAAIARLGGRVLPKLNWSAPVDAAWLVPNNCIACENADEVFLLLQASDRIADDLDQLAKLTEGEATPTLALRTWRALRPGREVRAFVVGGELAALCQRDVTQHVPGMAGDRADLAAAVGRLFADVVGPGFAAACAAAGGGGAGAGHDAPPATPPPLHYTFDAYVHASGKASLVDINPVGGATAPLLFEWGDFFPEEATTAGGAPTWPAGEELFAAGGGDGGAAPHIPFRIVDHAGAVTPGRTLYGAPHDMVAGEAVEELARRLRAGDLGPMQ